MEKNENYNSDLDHETDAFGQVLGGFALLFVGLSLSFGLCSLCERKENNAQSRIEKIAKTTAYSKSSEQNYNISNPNYPINLSQSNESYKINK